jgi:DNA mismatch repair ATPase MutS
LDGLGLAWATCELLLDKKCYTFCATHYLYVTSPALHVLPSLLNSADSMYCERRELTDLAIMYPNVKNVYLEVCLKRRCSLAAMSDACFRFTQAESQQDHRLKFLYKVRSRYIQIYSHTTLIFL